MSKQAAMEAIKDGLEKSGARVIVVTGNMDMALVGATAQIVLTDADVTAYAGYTKPGPGKTALARDVLALDEYGFIPAFEGSNAPKGYVDEFQMSEDQFDAFNGRVHGGIDVAVNYEDMTVVARLERAHDSDYISYKDIERFSRYGRGRRYDIGLMDMIKPLAEDRDLEKPHRSMVPQVSLNPSKRGRVHGVSRSKKRKGKK